MTRHLAPDPAFEICGDLPRGTTILEASAGTGKTFTIAALATRYVAEGRARLDELLLVTFGRMATHELRERIRERLISADAALADPAEARRSDDELIRLLADTTEAEASLRSERLSRALASFDSATIATTHQFCSQTLIALGIAADTDPAEEFTEDISELVTEVVDDIYLAKYGVGGAPEPAFGTELAVSIARAVANDPQAALTAGEVLPDSVAEARQRFAETVRLELIARRRARGLTTYDDLVERLHTALTDPVTGPDARRRLRERYRLVMVDEFQDTDPLQWEILRRTFHTHRDLVLIGDPKQAIYAFRGGDVVSYLAAADLAHQRATLAHNWRTDRPLVDAVVDMFGGVALGDPRITVPPVSARHPRRLTGAGAPFRIRAIPMTGGSQPPAVASVRERVARDAAADIGRLLSGGARLERAEGGQEPVEPGDIAVLVFRNEDAERMHRCLREVGVDAVLTGATNVYRSDAAAQWLRLLRAVERPQRQQLVRAAMLTAFMGWTGPDLASDGDTHADRATALLREWAADLATGGVARMMESANARTGMTERVLGLPEGERLLTDLRHIAEELHAVSRTGCGIAGLTEWLSERIRESESDSDEAARRLDTDADAVQVITMHRSKGLEFPIVYVPFAWDRWVAKSPDVMRLHREADHGHHQRLLDVRGPAAPQWGDNHELHDEEDAGESLRLLYVALTRAACQVVTWWAASRNTPASPLHRLLAARIAGDSQPDHSYPLTSVPIAALPSELGLSVELVSETPTDHRWERPTQPRPGLAAATFTRTVDTAWRRTSYSGLTAAAHEAIYADTDDPAGEPTDEPATGPILGAPADPGMDLPSPMSHLPGGTTLGLVVHHVFEIADTRAADLDQELLRCSGEALARRPITGLTPATLARSLTPSIRTPLGRLAAGRSLGDVSTSDRLAELDFEFPLAGGDHPTGAVFLRDVATLLRRHLPDDVVLAGYPSMLTDRDLAGQRLVGFLAGSIDAVLRLPRGGHDRFIVVDYKTNRLGARDGELTAWDYRPDALAQTMMAAHYPLQALLYSVALHRFLRWRLPDYRPERHLGGVLYLFVRGMCGPQTPAEHDTPFGVFAWEPPAQLVVDLSDLLNGGPG